MSLEQIIEEDMQRFIESEVRTEAAAQPVRLEEVYHTRRDWENEIHQQLKRNDIEGAKRVFNELKHHYTEIPHAHHTERGHVYETMQNCYLAIINAVQDRARTQMLLTHMQAEQDDVFDIHVKPINLQMLHREGPTSPPPGQEKLALPPQEQHDLSLPPPPFEEMVQPAAVAPTQRDVLASFRQQCTDIVEEAKRNPHVAHHMIGQTRMMLEKAPLQPAQRELLLEKLRKLEMAVHAYDAKNHFSERFAAAKQELLAELQSGNPEAVKLYDELMHRAKTFETAYPEYSGVFTKELQKLKDERGIYGEEEIVDRLSPVFGRLKAAMRAHDPHSFFEALSEMECFTSALPQGDDRRLLEAAAQTLRAKAQRKKVSLQGLLNELQEAKKAKDAARMRAAIEGLKRYTETLPPSPEKSLLEQTLQQLRSRKEVTA